MNQYKTTFIGELPPPFGGVTVKDKLMFDQIFKPCGTHMIDMVECKRKPWKIPLISCQVALGMLRSRTVIVGVGSTRRRKILLILQKMLTGRRGLKRIMLIVMGGQFHEQVSQDNNLLHLLKEAGSVWVESEKIVCSLQGQGIARAYLFPNCRTEEGAKEPVSCMGRRKLKLVFFSRICVEKGLDDIIAAYTKLGREVQNVTLDFYGELEEDIQEEFLSFVKEHDNVSYHGVFDATNDDVYAELNQYDVMLLPTHWKGEGVAGALIESKMAGITAIVSDWGFNREVVHDHVEGIVISQPIKENLAKVIKMLEHDRNLTQKLKQGAYESRKRYCINTYRQQLIDCAIH